MAVLDLARCVQLDVALRMLLRLLVLQELLPAQLVRLGLGLGPLLVCLAVQGRQIRIVLTQFLVLVHQRFVTLAVGYLWVRYSRLVVSVLGKSIMLASDLLVLLGRLVALRGRTLLTLLRAVLVRVTLVEGDARPCMIDAVFDHAV